MPVTPTIKKEPKPSTVTVSIYSLVRSADPEFEYERTHVTEYEFSRRRFIANPAKRGAYAT